MSNVLIPRHEIREGMRVECPRRSSVGAHDATVTAVTPVGSELPRSVVSLDCGHDVNMSDGHGLYLAGGDPVTDSFVLLDRDPVVGDWTIRDTHYVRVVAIVDHPAGHASQTVRTDMPAREWRTDDGGSRWSGIRPDGTPHHTPGAYARRAEVTR